MKQVLTVSSVVVALACVALAGVVLAQAPAGQPNAAGQQPAAPAPAAPGGQGRGGGGGGRAAITPRIVSFGVLPASIKPGESVVLSWATEASTPNIDNGVGSVPLRGSVRLSPKATTTYTLTAGTGITRAVTVTVAGTKPVTPAPVDAAAPANTAKPVARIDGKPDFSGIYGFTGMAGFGRGRGGAAAPPPPKSPFDGLPARPTLKAGVDNTATPNPAGGTSDCMPLPADTAFGVPYPFQIIQNKTHLVMINEYPGTFRIVPLEQPHRADAADDPTWMGDSVGRWDGDVLVIDTVGYNGMHAIGGIQQPSEKFHTIERLTRINGKDIYYEIVYEDSEKATGQWRATRTFAGDTRVGLNKIMEFFCENNRDYVPLFGAQGPPVPPAK